MKIVIYDTRHYEMVYVLFRIFNLPENEILFLVDKNLYTKLQSTSQKELINHSFCIQENNENSADYFLKADVEIKKFNPGFMILNTIDRDYKDVWHFLKKQSVPYLITIHNINTWLCPPFTLNRIALKNYYYRKKIVKRSSMVAVQEELFIDYIKNKKIYKKPLVTIPHTLKELEPVKINNDKIIITIPGGIDGVRRDNDLTLDVIEEVNKLSDRFHFVFAGRVTGHLGERIMKRKKELKKRGLSIQHVYDEQSNFAFDEQMKISDIILLPLNVNTKYEGITEIYGNTKVTGVIYDMMRFCKPGIVPEELVVPPTMKGSLITYKNKNDLVKILLTLANDREKLRELNNNAEKNSFYYTENEIRNRVLPQIKNNLLH